MADNEILSHCERFGHYCPNCDNSFEPQSKGEIAALRAEIQRLKDENAGLLSEVDDSYAKIREHQLAAQQSIESGNEAIQRLTTERDEAKAKADKTFVLHQQWLKAGMEAGFVFSQGNGGLQMKHDPEFALQLAQLSLRSDLEDKDVELSALRTELELTNKRLVTSEECRTGLVASNAALRARLDEAERETKRLDWLESEPAANEPVAIFHPPGDLVEWRIGNGDVFPELRQAIDAAMATPQPSGNTGELEKTIWRVDWKDGYRESQTPCRDEDQAESISAQYLRREYNYARVQRSRDNGKTWE